jgi:hypothetical protein
MSNEELYVFLEANGCRFIDVPIEADEEGPAKTERFWNKDDVRALTGKVQAEALRSELDEFNNRESDNPPDADSEDEGGAQ